MQLLHEKRFLNDRFVAKIYAGSAPRSASIVEFRRALRTRVSHRRLAVKRQRQFDGIINDDGRHHDRHREIRRREISRGNGRDSHHDVRQTRSRS